MDYFPSEDPDEARATEEARAAYTAAYHEAVDAMEAKYPEVVSETSKFSILLEHRVALAKVRRDPALDDPTFILKLADEIAAEMNAIRLQAAGRN